MGAAELAVELINELGATLEEGETPPSKSNPKSTKNLVSAFGLISFLWCVALSPVHESKACVCVGPPPYQAWPERALGTNAV